LEENILLKPRDKNIFLDLNIIWSKISDENRQDGFDMTDARLILDKTKRRPLKAAFFVFLGPRRYLKQVN